MSSLDADFEKICESLINNKFVYETYCGLGKESQSINKRLEEIKPADNIEVPTSCLTDEDSSNDSISLEGSIYIESNDEVNESLAGFQSQEEDDDSDFFKFDDEPEPQILETESQTKVAEKNEYSVLSDGFYSSDEEVVAETQTTEPEKKVGEEVEAKKTLAGFQSQEEDDDSYFFKFEDEPEPQIETESQTKVTDKNNHSVLSAGFYSSDDEVVAETQTTKPQKKVEDEVEALSDGFYSSEDENEADPPITVLESQEVKHSNVEIPSYSQVAVSLNEVEDLLDEIIITNSENPPKKRKIVQINSSSSENVSNMSESNSPEAAAIAMAKCNYFVTKIPLRESQLSNPPLDELFTRPTARIDKNLIQFSAKKAFNFKETDFNSSTLKRIPAKLKKRKPFLPKIPKQLFQARNSVGLTTKGPSTTPVIESSQIGLTTKRPSTPPVIESSQIMNITPSQRHLDNYDGLEEVTDSFMSILARDTDWVLSSLKNKVKKAKINKYKIN